MRDCKTCIHSEIGHGEGNGCTAWTCEYINKKEALEVYKQYKDIVRCKVCKYWHYIGEDDVVNIQYGLCMYNEYTSRIELTGEHYCSWGERREE